jgi:cytochrome c-type biogenesis protein CcmH
VALLALPLLRRSSTSLPAGAADLAVYRDQLAELERDRARGLVEPDQAVSLEAEISRRMLAVARSVDPAGGQTRPSRWLAVLLMAAVPVAAVLVYLSVGHPELPGLPLAGRDIAAEADPAKILATVERLKATLKPTKDDLNKWIAVGEAYRRLGHDKEAVEAFRTAVSISPDEPMLSAALAEALVAADGGTVGEEAKKRFGAVPANSPALPEARYYLALASQQSGDMKTALAGWQSLLKDSPADAAWIDSTRARIAETARALGLDPATVTPQPRPAGTTAADGQPPSAADIAQMTPEEKAQMIQGMVATLAARLEANPDDAAGWRRLARAYEVLGQSDKAKDALGRADAADHKAAAKP